MRLGIPRGYFYYDYYLFIDRLFRRSGVEIIFGEESNESILKKGIELTVDEACFPIKLFAGQLDSLERKCDKVLLPRIMKDRAGRWLCPKLLGLPELMTEVVSCHKYLVTDPVCFDDKKDTEKSFWKICKAAGISRDRYKRAFADAYSRLTDVFNGIQNVHVEAAWEFTPEIPGSGEILLPNTVRVLLSGHCYNVYDKFINANIMKKLDDLGIETVTEKDLMHTEIERAVGDAGLIKEPFWEAFVRIFGTAMVMKKKVDGIIYLSSFSCGLDAFIIEMIKNNTENIPMMVLKLDEHRGEAGMETRLEAFADLLERRRAL